MQNISGIHKIFSYPLIYSLTQIIMSGVSVRSALVKKIINADAKVLDIGCGTAKIIDSLPSVDYYGYDISKKYINYARKRYKSKRNNFFCKKFNNNEIDNIPKVDFIILFGVIHHLEDEELHQLFPALKKVLKKKGVILTCDPIYIKKQNTIAHFLIKNDVGKNVRNKSDYLKLLQKYFKKIKFKIKHQNFIPYTWFSTQCIK